MPADIVGTQVLEEDDDGRRRFRFRAGPGVRQPRARRRDQPGHAEDAVGAARGDAGAPGHRRRRDPAAAPAVPRDGDPEPARDGGHLPAARGPARPVPAQGARAVPVAPTSSSASSTARPATPPPTSSRWPTPTGCAAMVELTRQVPVAEHLTRHAVDLVVATHPDARDGAGAGAALRALRRVAPRRPGAGAGGQGRGAARRPAQRAPPTTCGPWPRPPCATGWCSATRRRPTASTADEIVADVLAAVPDPPAGLRGAPVTPASVDRSGRAACSTPELLGRLERLQLGTRRRLAGHVRGRAPLDAARQLARLRRLPRVPPRRRLPPHRLRRLGPARPAPRAPVRGRGRPDRAPARRHVGVDGGRRSCARPAGSPPPSGSSPSSGATS